MNDAVGLAISRYGWIGAAVLIVLLNADKISAAIARIWPAFAAWQQSRQVHQNGILRRRHELVDRADAFLAQQRTIDAYKVELDEAKEERRKDHDESKQERSILLGRLLEIVAANERRDQQFISALQAISENLRALEHSINGKLGHNA